MNSHKQHFRLETHATTAEGWTLERLTQPSRLYGANGLRTGADGRIYVAQVAGSQVSAIDVSSGDIETISPMGGDIVAPDDLAFDDEGNLYATEITEGRVSVRSPNGEYRVINGDMPCANPITMHQGHLYAGECRPGGRIMELDRSGGEARIILDDVPMPNAFEVGPDGKLYFPVMGANEIWRVDPKGGKAEVVATGLGVPDAVKFDADGYIVSTQVASGQVLRIDPSTGEQTLLAQLAPGLDNLTFVDGRLFVSSITGQISEITGPGQVKPLVADGLQWPLDVVVDDNGGLFVVDGGFTFTLPAGGDLQVAGMLFSPGFPGYSRGAALAGPGQWIVTTANGEVARYRPASAESEVLASGYDQLMGIAIAPDGHLFFAEYATGKVYALKGDNVEQVAADLADPKGVAANSGDACYVSESAAGRVVKITGNRVDTVIDGLQRPEGIALHGEYLYALDVNAKNLVRCNLNNGSQRVIATDLPVGAPQGVTPKFMGGVGNMCGPMGNFTGIDVGRDGTVYICGDAEGSVLALRPTR